MNETHYRKIVLEYKNLVYTQAYYSTGTKEDAEDITQEVFIRFWNYRTSIKRTSYKAWILKVTRNLCIDFSRRKKDYITPVSADDKDVDIAEIIGDNSPNPEQTLITAESIESIKQCINCLPEKMKSAVIMRDIQDHTYDSIAETMEMPLHSVKSYLHRGRKLLIKYIKNYSENNIQDK